MLSEAAPSRNAARNRCLRSITVVVAGVGQSEFERRVTREGHFASHATGQLPAESRPRGSDLLPRWQLLWPRTTRHARGHCRSCIPHQMRSKRQEAIQRDIRPPKCKDTPLLLGSTLHDLGKAARCSNHPPARGKVEPKPGAKCHGADAGSRRQELAAHSGTPDPRCSALVALSEGFTPATVSDVG